MLDFFFGPNRLARYFFLYLCHPTPPPPFPIKYQMVRLLGIAISCVRKMSLSVTSAKQEFTPPLFHYPPPGRWTMSIGQRYEPIRLLEIPKSLSLYMLMYFIPCLEKYSQSEATITVTYSAVCNG